MSGIVKFPAHSADLPDKYFCGLCGRKCQPILNDNVGFGPCIEGATSVIECRDLRRVIVQAQVMAAALERDLHPEWSALIARLGIPADLVAGWVETARRVKAAKDWLYAGNHPGMDGPGWLDEVRRWVMETDSDERLLLLIEELKVSVQPVLDGAQPMSMLDIMAWYQRLGDRARDLLSDPGDWETGGEDEG